MRMKLLLALPILAIALGACNAPQDPQLPTAQGSEQPSTGTSTPTPGGLAFTQCMRDNGIDLPDPDPDTGLPTLEGDDVDPDSPTFQKAIEACESLRPEGGVRGGGEVGPEELEKFQAFAECMRENGLPDFPDPQPGGSDGMFGGANVDRSSPAFQKAQEACGDILAGVTDGG